MLNRLKYTFIAIIFGIFIGFIVGYVLTSGTLNYSTTKGQRGDVTDSMNFIGGLIGAVVGLVIALTINSNIQTETKLGIDKMEEGMFQVGRKWIAKTVWIDPRTSKKMVLMTANSVNGTLVSALNDRTIHNHNITSGSKVNVLKAHQYARTNVFNIIKANSDTTNIEELFKEL